MCVTIILCVITYGCSMTTKVMTQEQVEWVRQSCTSKGYVTHSYLNADGTVNSIMCTFK